MKNSFLAQILFAMFLAVIAGMFTGPNMEIAGVPIVRIYDLIGHLFLNGLKLLIVPLVVSSIITGTARVGADQSFASLGGKTFGYFFLTGILAVLIGFAGAVMLQPWVSQDLVKTLTATSANIAVPIPGGAFDSIEGILFRLIPTNIFQVAAEGQMLGLIFFSVIFGVFSARIDSEFSTTVMNFWNGVFQIMMKMTHLVMKAMPIGVFGLMAKMVATTGLEAVRPVAAFFGVVILGLSVFTFIVLPLLLRFIAGVSPLAHFRAVGPALLTAFTTSSSAATLPITLECMEKRANIPNRFCSFILPLGTTVNLTGSALYATTAVLFIARCYGIDLAFGGLVTVGLLCLFTALGMVAGIPSATFVAITLILQSIGLPSESIILILPVERILDMFRTTVNVFCSTCVTVLVARR